MKLGHGGLTRDPVVVLLDLDAIVLPCTIRLPGQVAAHQPRAIGRAGEGSRIGFSPMSEYRADNGRMARYVGAGPARPLWRRRMASGIGPEVAGGKARSARFIVIGVVLTRLLGLAELTTDVNVGWYRIDAPRALILAVAVLGESAALVTATWKRGSVARSWAVGDAIFMAIGLIAFASQRTLPFDPWTFMFQFSFTSAVTLGVAFQRLRSVLLWQCVPAGAYAATAIWERNAGWNVPQDLVSYFGSAVVVWALARELRNSGDALDLARADAVARESALAVERARARDLRDLHDRVLQTLEVLARGSFIDDDRVQAQVFRDAFWLRRHVADQRATAGAEDLGAVLATVIGDHIAGGLKIRTHIDGLRENVDTTASQALVGAVSEALTNISKHAGVKHAVVRAMRADAGITVSVVDSGRGFDPELAANGLGLRESICARLEQVGGHARIDSRAGSGTCIEMWVPVSS